MKLIASAVIVISLSTIILFGIYDTEDTGIRVYVNSESVIEIENLSLDKSGFFVVRGITDKGVDQIIEISAYLKKGEDNSAEIDISNLELDLNKLSIVFQQDNGDMVFSSYFDHVYIKDNEPIGIKLKDGSMLEYKDVMNLLGDRSGVNKIVKKLVSYTDSGYYPNNIKINKGESVEFKNNSSVKMWVASDSHPSHSMLPSFDQFGVSEVNESYIYTFDKVGVWGYHDHINATRVGTIEVIE